MRLTASLLLAGMCASALPSGAGAQVQHPHGAARAPIVLSVTLPLDRPPVSTNGALVQTGMGILGGLAAGAIVGLPLMLAAWGGNHNEGVMVAAMGGAFVGGTALGIHRAGRAQGMSGNPWATVGGVVGGLMLSGAMMQPLIDDEGNAGGPGPLLVFVLPSMGGTAGYLLTRRGRERSAGPRVIRAPSACAGRAGSAPEEPSPGSPGGAPVACR